ncbi:MAG: hypothetical protein JW797_19140 [Bradymonadales bacterium]|nr:hypothetical protein [Bradymonadales bacterium]
MQMRNEIQVEEGRRTADTARTLLVLLGIAVGLFPSCFPAPTWQPQPTYTPPSGSTSTAVQVTPTQTATVVPTHLVVDGVAYRHDSLAIQTGFYPDPFAIAGLSGGTIEASYLGNTPYGACLGYTEANPNHMMTLSTAMDYLRLEAASSGHLSLLILGPDGWRCRADTRPVGQGGVAPVIEGSWPAGTYRVWVGTYGKTTQYNYSLSFSGTPLQAVTVPTTPRELDTQSGSTRYQSLRLLPGFQPDPQRVDGTSGSGREVDVSYLGTSASGPCRGVTDALPSHRIALDGPFTYLRLRVESQSDTTLVVHGPTGWLCNDDSVGLDPQIESAFPAGTLRVWVGSYRSGEAAPYLLTVSGQPVQAATPQVDPTGGAYTPRHGSLALATGFSPDPQTTAGVSGGSQPVSGLGGSQTATCAGYTELAPSHMLYLNSAFDYLRLDAEAEGDTTLLVAGPGGWMCDDDTAGSDPRIAGSFAAGTYRIWVGSADRRERHSYTLSVTTQPVRPVFRPGRRPRLADDNLRGALVLSPGFEPDPQVVAGQAGGDHRLSDLGGQATQACGGFAGSSAGHTLILGEDFSYLRLEVSSDGNTTLAMEGPQGWTCNDDAVGENPRLEGPFAAGTYRIWVGTHYPDSSCAYSLSITESPPSRRIPQRLRRP